MSRTLKFLCSVLLAGILAGGGVASAQQKGPPPGEQPKQLAAPNGPPQPDPNQAPASKTTAENGGRAEAQSADETLPPNSANLGDWAAPLRRYEGTWVRRGEHTDQQQTVSQICHQTGARFYSCEDSVNGETIELRIFVPGDEPGHYFTQSVLPSGTALGRGDLAVNGDTWVWNKKTIRDDGAVNYQRMTFVFSGRDKDTIHFQVERSDDEQHWSTVSTGVEKRRK